MSLTGIKDLDKHKQKFINAAKNLETSIVLIDFELRIILRSTDSVIYKTVFKNLGLTISVRYRNMGNEYVISWSS